MLRSDHQRKYPELNPSMWYERRTDLPGVTQRMVNMAGERLTRLATPRGFVILRAEHLEFRPSALEDAETRGDSESIA